LYLIISKKSPRPDWILLCCASGRGP